MEIHKEMKRKIERLVSIYCKNHRIPYEWQHDILQDVFLAQTKKGQFTDTFINRRIVDSLRNRLGRNAHRSFEQTKDPVFWKKHRFHTEDMENRIFAQQLISLLNEKEKRIIQAMYFEGALQMEVADELGYHESRISQLHSEICAKLRAAIG
jgi:RNA polymerase sigma factor (sigma-70 family)